LSFLLKKNSIAITLLVREKINFKNLISKPMASITRENYRFFILTCWKNNMEAKEIHQLLSHAWGNDAPSIVTIRQWINKFESGEENIEEKPRSGRPNEAVSQRNIDLIEEAVNKNPHITTRELERNVGISHERVVNIIHKHLGLKKVTAKWIPHKLTEENKHVRVECSRQLLDILEGGFSNIITGDETWVYFFTVSSKEQNKVWIGKEEQRPQIVRTSRFSKKRMFCVFYTVDGCIARIVVPEGKTVNGEFYGNEVLPNVFKKFREIRNRKTVQNVMLYHDNALPHKHQLVKRLLQQEQVNLLPHPPYSPDLSPCDFFLFPRLKKELAGRSYNEVNSLARGIQAVVDSIPKEDYYKSFED